MILEISCSSQHLSLPELRGDCSFQQRVKRVHVEDGLAENREVFITAQDDVTAVLTFLRESDFG